MRNTKYYIAGSVSLITFAVYLVSLQNDFVQWDDDAYVYENPNIRSFDLRFFKWAFSSFYASNWHPLTWISHALDYAVWGLNPMGHHLTNNILHAINTFIVVLLVVKLLEIVSASSPLNSPHPPLKLRGGAEGGGVILSGFSDKSILIAAATTGLLFGLHPLHVESVAWVSERKDLLCALFFLLSIMMYIRYITPPASPPPLNLRGGRGSYLLSLLFFTLALMSKPMAVSLPFVLLILDWYPFQRILSLKTFRKVVIEKLPFFALSLFSSVLTVLAQKSGEAIVSIEAVPLSSRMPVAFQSLVLYLCKMLLPLNLLPLYPYPQNVIFFSLEYLVPMLLVTGITAACALVVRKNKLWLSVLFYYLITLLPVLGIVQVGGQAMADRYSYLPSIGPFLIAGIMTSRIYNTAAAARQWRLLLKMGGVVAASTLLALLSYASVQQIGIWKNGLVLWSYVIEKEPLNVPRAYNNLGYIFLREGQIDNAIAHFRTAIDQDPAYAHARNNLCIAYKSYGLYDKAIEQCRIAIGLKPDYAEAYNNLGIAYKYMGLDDKAMELYRKALSLDPDYAEAFFNLGIVYLDKGDMDMARRAFESGLKIKPDDLKARQVLDSINLKQ